MNSILKFNSRYFVLAVLLFGIEILIAKFAHDQILRQYVGDLLVVILIYCFVKSFLATPFINTALAVLAFSYTVASVVGLLLTHQKLFPPPWSGVPTGHVLH